MIEIVEVKENQALTSLEVAEMVGKEHKLLMRDVRRYIKQLNECNIAPIDFFNESTYIDERNRAKPCYNVTKKGCEFIAHKMTGPKGTEFTARYINRFHEMENKLKNSEIPLLDGKSKALLNRLMVEEDERPKAPLNPDWYDRNVKRIHRIANMVHVEGNDIFQILVARLKEKYDMQKAQEIYKKNVGKKPENIADVIGYFKEMGDMADRLLDRMERNIYGR